MKKIVVFLLLTALIRVLFTQKNRYHNPLRETKSFKKI